MPQAAGEGTLVPMERPWGREGLKGAARPGSNSEPRPCLLCDPWQSAPISGPQVLSDSGCDGKSRIWRPMQPLPTAPVLVSRLVVCGVVKSSGHGMHSPPSAGLWALSAPWQAGRGASTGGGDGMMKRYVT